MNEHTGRLVGAGPARARCLAVLEAFGRGWAGEAPNRADPLAAFVIEGRAAGAVRDGDEAALVDLRAAWPATLVDLGAGLGCGLSGARAPVGADEADGFGFWWGLVRGEVAWRTGRPAPHGGEPADVGQGRALWFWSAGDADLAARLVAGAPAHRQAALWAGLGTAAVFTGGAAEQQARLRVAAATHRAAFVFGEARARLLQV